jgi:hypothetical protein
MGGILSMSRWTDRFKSHQFQQSWRQVKESLHEARANDETVPTEVTELGRLKRIVSYIDGLLRSLDPELVPLGVWDNFHPQAEACAQQIRAFNESRSIGHIQTANDHADNLLTYVRPYMVVTGRHAKNLRDSAAEYISALDDYLKQFGSRAAEATSHIDLLVESIEEMQSDAVEARGLITVAVEELLGSSETIGKVGEFDKRLQDFQEKYGEIVDYYNETLVGEEGGESTKESISKAAISVKKDAATARESLQGNKALIDELTIFYGKIFGVVSEDGSKTGGLDDELSRHKNALGRFEEEQKVRYGALNQQIEDLLPGAASAGLASAYGQMRTSFDAPLLGASRLFYWAIAGIVLASLVMTVDKVWFWGIDFTPVGDFSTVARSFLYKLPILGPLVWLAYYASRRRSECQRLQQEYAHKEALAKSYDSYRKQIQDLGGEKAEMLETLIAKAVEAISYNASGTLDGRHGDSPPFQAVIDKLLDKVPDAPKVG